MIRSVLLICLTFLVGTLQAQNDERSILRGTVLYRNLPVPNENVINIITENTTITDESGRFEIPVKEGDELAFTAVNYQLQVVKITDDILQRNRLVVEVNEKVTELDEVVVSPDDQERFIEVQNEELKEFEYETDRSTEVENIAMPQYVRGMRDGLNIANIFRALMRSAKKQEANRPNLKVSQVLRQVYDDEFFVVDLKIRQENIDNFLVYVDERAPDYTLLLKDNEFQLIEFLVEQSQAFRKEIGAGE